MTGRSFTVKFYRLIAVIALVFPLTTLAATTSRVSVDSQGVEANRDGNSSSPTISADGRFVAFSSSATNLVAGDNNKSWDIFVHDRQTGVTTRVNNYSKDGEHLFYRGVAPSISADGRFVTFGADSPIWVEGDHVLYSDIFIHDRQTGDTVQVNVDTTGNQVNGDSDSPSISANGRFVAFQSAATNLVEGDTSRTRDIFVYDHQTGGTTRVSVGSTGVEANGYSSSPSISADGHFVAFTSRATNLVEGDTNDADDIFVHDRRIGATTLISITSLGGEANYFGSSSPSISADGRFVAFSSRANNLVAGDTNLSTDVFVHDRQTGATSRVSVDSAGYQTYADSSDPSISADGRFVVFRSISGNLVGNDANGKYDIFVHDRQSATTTRVSIDSTGGEANSASYSNSVSAGGRFVAFSSSATNLVAGDNNKSGDIFVHGPLNPPFEDGPASPPTNDQDNEPRTRLGSTIKTVDGTDICALILANGKFTFSCNPNGVFFLDGLPRDNNSMVKRMIFADGYYPKIDNFSETTDENVVMTPSGICPNYNAPYAPDTFTNSAGKWITIWGSVLVQDSKSTLCAMVLANGQYTFSCMGGGYYVLNIPLDSNGQYKLQVYADGFASAIQTFDEFSLRNDVRMAQAEECQLPQN